MADFTPDERRHFSQRLRELMNRKGWSQKQLSDASGINAGDISDYLAAKKMPLYPNMARLADVFGETVEQLTMGQTTPAPVRAGEENPKPLVFADSHVDDIYLVIGNHTSPLKVGVRYDPARMTVPASLLQKGVYKQLADKAEKNARDKGYQYFNGPNTRLLRVTQELTDQTASGHEESGIMLEVGPLSWEQFTVLNCFLDQDVPGESGCGTLRQQFASRRMLFENTTDLRWCELSNLLTVHMIPITSDGYGLVTVRNPKTVSIAGSKLGSGITENIHRYLDEASAGHLDVRLHELMLPIEASKNVPIDYSPRGVPSPLLTAQRGFLEEVSERLYFDIRGDEHRFKFLNVVFDLKLFIPKLIGIVELEVNSDELRRMIHESPGKDHGEVREHHFLKLDAANANTRDFMGREWDLGGLAAFATAMQYWSVRVMGKR